jgi:putative transposase
MSLCVNMLVEWQTDGNDRRVDRVLWIDPTATNVVMIDIADNRALPVWRSYAEIESALVTTKVHILELDPYARLLCPESSLSENERRRRDESWSLIAPLVKEPGGEIFLPAERGPLVAAVAEHTGRTKRLIYGYLRRYWQSGQTKNALLPHFDRCGGKGKERSSSERKRGRPSTIGRATGQPTGINVDADIRERFHRGIRLFYENRAGRRLTQAYQLTLEKFFHTGYELRDGVLVPVLRPADELPTLSQFRYWYEKERNPAQAIAARKGQRRFETDHRAVLGDSTHMAFGPGSLYQIDATPGDIYLVSSLDPSRIIGRPVIYVVIDVFSRLIAGLGVSLEGPSWLSAMLALENATLDKVAFCAEYGISITEDEWPSHHLPEALLADRGELEGYNADNLVNALGVCVSNTAPYRADWKGIVEQNFRLSNEKLIHWLPGAVYQARQRGDADYRLDACLNLYQFRQLMIYCVLHHNNEHRMDWYRLDEFMIGDHVDPYPIDLWNWGVQNRVGHLRAMAQDVVRLNLLPQKEASVTRNGILFQGLHYGCDLALQEQWFVRARERGSWRLPVVYDPRKLDVIYLRLDHGQRVEPCYLHESDRTFCGHDWQDTLDYLELRKQASKSARTRQQQADAELHARIEHIVGPAKKQAEEARRGQSKRSRLAGIKDNRKAEREIERRDGAWQLAPEEVTRQPGEDEPVDQSNDTRQGYVPPPQPTDTLRRLRQEKLSHE